MPSFLVTRLSINSTPSPPSPYTLMLDAARGLLLLQPVLSRHNYRLPVSTTLSPTQLTTMRAGAIAAADVRGREIQFNYIVGGSDIFVFNGIKEVNEAATCMSKMHIRVNVGINHGETRTDPKNEKKDTKTLENRIDTYAQNKNIRNNYMLNDNNIKNDYMNYEKQFADDSGNISVNNGSNHKNSLQNDLQTKEYNCIIFYAHKTYECLLALSRHSVRCLRTITNLEIFRLTYPQLSALMIERVGDIKHLKKTHDKKIEFHGEMPTITFLLSNGKYFIAKFKENQVAQACIDDIVAKGGVRVLEAYDYYPDIDNEYNEDKNKNTSVKISSDYPNQNKEEDLYDVRTRKKSLTSNHINSICDTSTKSVTNNNEISKNERTDEKSKTPISMNAISPLENINQDSKAKAHSEHEDEQNEYSDMQKERIEDEENLKTFDQNNLAFNTPAAQVDNMNKIFESVAEECRKDLEEKKMKENILKENSNNENNEEVLMSKHEIGPKEGSIKEKSIHENEKYEDIAEINIRDENDISIRVMQMNGQDDINTTDSIKETSTSTTHYSPDESKGGEQAKEDVIVNDGNNGNNENKEIYKGIEFETKSPEIDLVSKEDNINTIVPDLESKNVQSQMTNENEIVDKAKNVVVENINLNDGKEPIHKSEDEAKTQNISHDEDIPVGQIEEKVDSGSLGKQSLPHIEGIAPYTIMVQNTDFDSFPQSQTLPKKYSKQEMDTVFRKFMVPTKGDIIISNQASSAGLGNETEFSSNWAITPCSLRVSADNISIEATGKVISIPKECVSKLFTGIVDVKSFQGVQEIIGNVAVEKALTLILHDGDDDVKALFIQFKIPLYQKKLVEAILLMCAYRDNPADFV